MIESIITGIAIAIESALIVFIIFNFAKSKREKKLRIITTTQSKAAVHEAGHAIAVWYCSDVEVFKEACIFDEPENNFDGVVRFQFLKKENLNNKQCQIIIDLSGLAAEVMVFGKMHSGGARNDLNDARSVVAEIAKMPRSADKWRLYTSQTIDLWQEKTVPFEKMFHNISEIEADYLKSDYLIAKKLIEKNMIAFYKLVAVLLAAKTLHYKDVEQILGPRDWIIPLRNEGSTFL